jgi:hypothetical protein
MRGAEVVAAAAVGLWSGVLASVAHGQADDDDFTTTDDYYVTSEGGGGGGGDNSQLTIAVLVGGGAMLTLLMVAVFIYTSPVRGSAALALPTNSRHRYARHGRIHQTRNSGGV